MVRDNDLFTDMGIAPLLVATSLGDEHKTVLLENPNDLAGFQCWKFFRHYAGISTSKTFFFGLSFRDTGSR